MSYTANDVKAQEETIAEALRELRTEINYETRISIL